MSRIETTQECLVTKMYVKRNEVKITTTKIKKNETVV